jgi:hypothetical protein
MTNTTPCMAFDLEFLAPFSLLIEIPFIGLPLPEVALLAALGLGVPCCNFSFTIVLPVIPGSALGIPLAPITMAINTILLAINTTITTLSATIGLDNSLVLPSCNF